MKWDLTCGPLTRTLVFGVKSVNDKPVNDLGVTVLYSQDDTSLEILNIKKFSRNPKPVYLHPSSEENPYGLTVEDHQGSDHARPVPNGAQSPIAEKPSADEVDAVQGIALCDSAKCVFMVAVHNTKETAKHITSKVKSIFCDGKPRGPHHRGKHHDEHDVDKDRKSVV